MSINVNLVNDNNDHRVKVSSHGQLIVAPIDFSTPVTKSLAVIDTAVNFIAPQTGHFIVITDIIASADKDVSNTSPANVDVYESDEVDSLTIVNEIVSPQLIRAANLPLTGLNLKIPEGLWVNAKTSDAAILLTIMFYRVRV